MVRKVVMSKYHMWTKELFLDVNTESFGKGRSDFRTGRMDFASSFTRVTPAGVRASLGWVCTTKGRRSWTLA